MKKILALGGSNSSKSINKTFATFVANQVSGAEVTVADLNELELPLYSQDLEAANGIHANATKFSEMITEADGIVLSLAEHNGMITAAFKNLWDWTSRLDQNVWKKKPMLLMATSPGGRGGQNALRVTNDLLPHFGGNVIATFSLPGFFQNFTEEGVQDDVLKTELNEKIQLFQEAL